MEQQLQACPQAIKLLSGLEFVWENRRKEKGRRAIAMPPTSAPESWSVWLQQNATMSWCWAKFVRFPAAQWPIGWCPCARPTRPATDPARRRARSSSAEISNSGARASYSAPHLGIGQQPCLELVEGNGHSTSFARRSASSISARGVACVFFTNARTTTTRLPIAVTYKATCDPVSTLQAHLPQLAFQILYVRFAERFPTPLGKCVR